MRRRTECQPVCFQWVRFNAFQTRVAAGGAAGASMPGQGGAVPSRTLTVPRVLAKRAICAICLTRQATEPPLSPAPCYMLCAISQGKPLNLHSPPPLAICAICAIWVLHANQQSCILYTYISTWPNMPCVAHTVYFNARLGSHSTYSTYSKEPGDWGFSGCM